MQEEITAAELEGKSPTEIATYYFEHEYSVEEVEKVMKQRKITFPTITEVMSDFMKSKDISVRDISNLSDMNQATIHRILNKERNPGRNVILRIAIAMALNIQETQILLKSGNCAQLSVIRKRDLVIMEGIAQEKDYETINETLKEKGMPDLNMRM